ncbi:MAG: Uma2 family endonuclease [Okeania sp. SIO2G4]|uniref:Uma2 family endonuclease n=1 Tax=unclassified Okeania TaxID=2634635 RepID=UPI0013BD0649|nr:MULTISPECIES: Uma2 family endonuclease [unclassified Okeania]NEP08447.1 Uma2 family endonuclease [Okeania sp. SIO4D6]NEP38594.1 Uma2 family endonuclease [Okeania sp. SIO2H7]NEP71800.1 Uma2 family endonuclease [Okeania sp. SIO2G5]NEP92411.1 Uma2 family endonuclease [Okeania sp. SIO2F5]NEQ91812.1 Uma2 family endonuclease [Okeania sp. SIO2G4]
MENQNIYLPPRLELKIDLTDEQFWQLCQENDDLRFEKSATGELIIMSPTGSITGERNSELNFQLRAWNRQKNLGKVFDSNSGFKLPNGAERSPDSSWISNQRWDTLTLEEQDKFAPLCPDFVVELMSPSDTLEKTRAKMREYIGNGAKLGWLINRKKRQLEIYRPQQDVEILENSQTVSGENILPGFILDLTLIW